MERLRMKDLPESERPYEMIMKNGVESLSDAQLIATIIKSGTKDETSVQVAQRILNAEYTNTGLTILESLSIQELKNIKGIGNVKACQLKAVFEISKRISKNKATSKSSITTPQDVSNVFMEDMRYLKQEYLKVLNLDIKNRIICIDTVAIGNSNMVNLEPGIVFRKPVKVGASSIILCHNHPSGEPSPSIQDIKMTQRLIKAGNILDITLLDHIIIGDGKYISMKQNKNI